MRIVFFDSMPMNYTVETPYQQPLGGAQSAACYLAAELARLGHKIAIVNNTTAAGVYRGVDCVDRSRGQTAVFLNDFDVVVALGDSLGLWLRNELGVTVPLVFWNPHTTDQPAVQSLRDASERATWSAFAFMTQWQLDTYVSQFDVPRTKSRVMRNAVAPAFANIDPGPPWFSTGSSPTLFYTSTPFRGLDVLLGTFPVIRAAIPGIRLRVFSSMATYQVRQDLDNYSPLYAYCRSQEGIEYVGAISQSSLAQELSGAAALTYPSTFPETSCIAALEAMAVGARILTTRLGALPETTGRFSRMIEYQNDRVQLGRAYAAMVINDLSDIRRNSARALSQRNEQIAFIRENYTWPGRAIEWVNWLTETISA
jgi:glycosyltransferase involved in cell wall biosynthesis